MAWWKIAFLMAILLILLILFHPLGPIWFIAFLILFGIIIAIVVLRQKKTKENGSRYAGQALDHGIDMASASGPTPAGDARARAVHASESSSSSSGFKYDLYLSFRDEDADEFVRLLPTQLKRQGVRVFSDNKRLRKGEEIGWELKEEIKQSKICIPILSRNFPSNKLCLDELVQMWECRESTGQTIFPIFYGVSPSDVEHQTGDFGTSFSPHKEKVDAKFIETWEEVLRWIGRMTGLSMKDLNRNKAEAVAKVLRVMEALKIEERVPPNKIGEIIDIPMVRTRRKNAAKRMK